MVITISAVTIAAGLAAPAAAAPKPAPSGGVLSMSRAPSGTGSGAEAQLSAGRAGTVHYAVIKPACAAPADPSDYQCLALRRVDVAKGTANAKAYVRPAYSVGPAGGFTPADLASAYGFDARSSVGATQTIAIVDWNNDPHARADLNSFDAHYGLPAETSTSLRIVNQNGASSPLPAITSETVEITLDLESARAVCNRCKILLVEASAASATSTATAENTAARLHATEISNSYGAPEAPAHPASSSVVAAYNHPGIVITASTGDHGWYDWDFANDYDSDDPAQSGASDDAPLTPASYPSVISVAGTVLLLNPDGTRKEEDVWNEDGPDDANGIAFGTPLGDKGASGGGCSLLYSAPSFQSATPGYAATGCAGKKMVGDVAALADPYTGFDVFDSGNGGWQTIGGTSLASPIVAALWALAGGSGGERYPAASLYDNYRFRASSTLYDVKAGGSGFCAGDSITNCSATVAAETSPSTGSPNNLITGTNQHPDGWVGLLDCSYPYDRTEAPPGTTTDPECNAVTGYDGASGVGSPRGVRVFQRTEPRATITRPSVMKLRTTETFRANLSDPVAHASAYSWSFGDGTARTSSDRHEYRRAGTYTVSVTVTDSVGQRASATTRVTVGRALALKMTERTSAKRNRTYRWTAGGSDPNTGGRFVRYVWNWGDGHSTTSRYARVTHRYTRLGKHTITLTITDNAGVRTSRRERVRVVR